ncbi:hypothetical protein [Gracilibacillus suaedae]|uniref:hypothetical protein n=1 Tax=Gracilibacillus suaedae TaxID=2820273 RepID=UPI001ABE9828|nr:hypothetical protein [Gracilibacillus suaedae]
MKKWLILISITLVFLIPYVATQVVASDDSETQQNEETGLDKSKENGLDVIPTLADYLEHTKLSPMEDSADLIVVGTPTKDFTDREHKEIYNEDDKALMDFYTITNIKVRNIIKDKNNAVSNNTLDVIEPISVIEEEGTEKIITTDVYSYMKKDSTYVIFLKENTFGDYTVINLNGGKYDLSGKDEDDLRGYNSEKLLEFRPDKTEIKKKIFEEIKNSYKIDIQ